MKTTYTQDGPVGAANFIVVPDSAPDVNKPEAALPTPADKEEAKKEVDQRKPNSGGCSWKR